MTDNLSIWNALANVDPKFTKPITGKPYKGTSPNPHYIVQMLTEKFGPAGQGWGVRVMSEGFQPLGDEVLHWCRVEMWHTDRSNTFEAYGQTKALAQTSKGLRSDEDAPKKSFTDAMVKAASYIGCAANIFLGRWDDSRFVAEVNQEFRQKEAQASVPKLAIERAVELIRSQLTLDDLRDYFVALQGNERQVAGHPDVIAAKDKRKAELSAAQ